MGLGQLSHIGIGKEVDWGSAVPATDYLKFNSETLTKSIEELVSAQLDARRDEPESYPGLHSIAGDTIHEVHPKSLGYMLRSWFGNPVTTEIEAGVYEHVFTPGNVAFSDDCQVPPYTLEVNRDLGANNAFQYAGMVANILAFAFGTGAKILTLTTSWIGKDVQPLAKTSPSLEQTKPFLWDQALIKIGGSPFMDLETLNFTLDNGLVGVPLLNNTNLIGKILGDTFRLGTIAPTFRMTDLAQYNKFRDWTQQAFEIKFTSNEELPGHSPHVYELTFVFPKVRYTAFPPLIAGSGRIMAAATGKIKYDSVAGYLAQVTLKNDKASY